jgi:hypothetical protein
MPTKRMKPPDVVLQCDYVKVAVAGGYGDDIDRVVVERAAAAAAAAAAVGLVPLARNLRLDRPLPSRDALLFHLVRVLSQWWLGRRYSLRAHPPETGPTTPRHSHRQPQQPFAAVVVPLARVVAAVVLRRDYWKKSSRTLHSQIRHCCSS